jgi:hypothetical protein
LPLPLSLPWPRRTPCAPPPPMGHGDATPRRYRPSSAARPPKKHGPASRRPRPSAESAPLLCPSRSTACRRDPRRRRTQHPSCYLRQAPRRRQRPTGV